MRALADFYEATGSPGVQRMDDRPIATTPGVGNPEADAEQGSFVDRPTANDVEPARAWVRFTLTSTFDGNNKATARLKDHVITYSPTVHSLSAYDPDQEVDVYDLSGRYAPDAAGDEDGYAMVWNNDRGEQYFEVASLGGLAAGAGVDNYTVKSDAAQTAHFLPAAVTDHDFEAYDSNDHQLVWADQEPIAWSPSSPADGTRRTRFYTHKAAMPSASDLGCGLEIVASQIAVDNDDLVGNGIAANPAGCGLHAVAGCGIIVDAEGIHFDAANVAGEGLIHDDCKLNLNIDESCGLLIADGKLALDTGDLAGVGLGSNGCQLGVRVGCGIKIDDNDQVAVDIGDLIADPYDSLEGGLGTCSLKVKPNCVIRSFEKCKLFIAGGFLHMQIFYKELKVYAEHIDGGPLSGDCESENQFVSECTIDVIECAE